MNWEENKMTAEWVQQAWPSEVEFWAVETKFWAKMNRLCDWTARYLDIDNAMSLRDGEGEWCPICKWCSGTEGSMERTATNNLLNGKPVLHYWKVSLISDILSDAHVGIEAKLSATCDKREREAT